jgi:tRNA A-37 threonylcarbamoyl transferase component Bud32
MSGSPTCPRCGSPLPPGSPEQLCPRCLLEAGVAESTAPPYPTAAYGTAFRAPDVAELQRLFPAYEILELIGQGGMGAVYKARQVSLDRLVALKILPPQVGRDPAFAERCRREARALARLSHPHIVAIHDSGEVGGLFYFVMEYIDGINLRQAMRSAQLAPDQALAIVPQVCDALQYAHDEGVVHRDIKPENLLLDRRGRVKIADFGLAKLLGMDAGDLRLTGTQQAMGTLHYMAPEQVEGARTVDHRADIYSLGVTFYEMLTGELPIGRFAPPSCKVHIDVRLDEVVLRTLEKEPEKRYQHVSEVKTDVDTIRGLSSAAAQAAFGREYRSKIELFGVPLIHIAFGLDPRTGRKRVAKGIVAVGDTAVGVIAVGGVALGGVSGGGLAAGLFSFGGLSLGLLMALGGLAVGGFAFGGCAVGGLAFGGIAVGYYAIGGSGLGVVAVLGERRDPEAVELFMPLLENAQPLVTGVWIVFPILGVLLALFIWAFYYFTDPRRHQKEEDAEQQARRAGAWLLAAGVVYWVVAVLTGVTIFAIDQQRNDVPLVIFNLAIVAAVFAGTLMIVGGSRLMKLEKSGVISLAAGLALLPITPGWLIGLPAGLRTLLVLGRRPVRQEMQRREDAERERQAARRRPDRDSPWYALGWLVGRLFRLSVTRILVWTAACAALVYVLGLPGYELHWLDRWCGTIDRWYWPYQAKETTGLSLSRPDASVRRLVVTELREARRLGWNEAVLQGMRGALAVHEFTVQAMFADGRAGPVLHVDARDGLKWHYEVGGETRRGDFPVDFAVGLQFMCDSGVPESDAAVGNQTWLWSHVLLEAASTDQVQATWPTHMRAPVGRLERLVLKYDNGPGPGARWSAPPFSERVGTERLELAPVFNILWISLPTFLVLWLGGLWLLLRRRYNSAVPVD